MSNRKNYNSIVFLTVYLGLVLVGGSAQVLANAATPRLFDIKTEIVVEDDLDKKPDEDLFLSSVVNLVEEINKLSEKGDFYWNVTETLQIEDLGISESDNSPSYLGSGSITKEADRIIKKSAFEIARKLFAQKSALDNVNSYSYTIDYNFSFDKKSLTIKANVSNNFPVAADNDKSVQPFADLLTTYLTRINSSKDTTKQKVVAENTKVTTENNQVFIVTRLPRGSIDAILARKDAQ